MKLARLLSRSPRARGARPAPSPTGLGLNRICNIEDFGHPDVRDVIRSVFAHELGRLGPDFPAGAEYRKHWEVAMAVRALTEMGAVHDRAQILGVAAGNEPTIFWLTNRVARVFATDLYADPGIWEKYANSSMLRDPGRHWPGPWNPRRLVVQHMNALDLQYDDATFDGAFSSSSIEHFGTHADVRRAMAEIYRVLKPGGVASISTEFRLEGDLPGAPGSLMFNEDDLRRHLIGDLPWEVDSPLELEPTAATLAAELSTDDYMADLDAHNARFGEALWHELTFTKYPVVALRSPDFLFVSVHLALRKPARTS